MLQTATPYDSVRAVILNLIQALETQAGWLVWLYAVLGILGAAALIKINRLKPESISEGFQAHEFAKQVLEKIQDQAARFIVTFGISFAVFCISLSLNGGAAQIKSIIWFRAFPAVGFALLQIDAIYRWNKFLKSNLGL